MHITCMFCYNQVLYNRDCHEDCLLALAYITLWWGQDNLYTDYYLVVNFLHAMNIGVCSFTIYDVRLSGQRSGTVQVLTHLGWQQLCSSSWSTSSSSEESRVFCRQLGYDVIFPSILINKQTGIQDLFIAN